MPEINVDRIRLSLSGISEEDGRELARCIADGLTEATVSHTARGSEAMQASLTFRPGSSMPELAGQVVADLVRQLNRAF